MKGKIKVALCILLAAAAVMSLAAVLGGIGALDAAAAEEDAYLLREYDGYIGVYYPAEAEEPTTVTDIRVSDLPLADRLALSGGVGAEDYSAVIRLLEDYGA